MTTTQTAANVKVGCTVTGTELVMEIRNEGAAPVYLLKNDRMPYVMHPGAGKLTVEYGVHAPDPDADYYMIEIPSTQELAAGASIQAKVSLSPLVLSDHYEGTEQATLTGTHTVTCRAAWGAEPITEAKSRQMGIKSLIAWQTWVDADAVTVEL